MGDRPMGHSLFHAAVANDEEEEEEEEESRMDPRQQQQQQQQSPALQEIVHREQLKHHVHSHSRIHRRNLSSADTSAEVTEVTQTVSVIEQVDVNTAGSTFSTQDVPQTSTLPTAIVSTASIEPGSLSSYSIETGSASSSSITPSPPADTTVASTAGSSTDTTISQPGSSDSTAIPSTATTTFATITAGSNSSTTLTSSSTSSGSLSSSINFSTTNITSTSTSTSSSSFSSTLSSSISGSSVIIFTGSLSTTSDSSRTPTSSSLSATSFVSSTQSTSTSTSSGTSTSYTSSSTSNSISQSATGSSSGLIGTGPTGISASSAATSTSTSVAGNSSSNGNTTNTPTGTVVASVFGGIAGVGLILVFFLFLIKWHRRRLARNQALGGSSDRGIRDSTTPVNQPPSPARSMSERPRFALPAGLAALASFKPNRASRQTMATVSSTAGSEQGFYRVSGRKIQSVLESGGDGYGDPSTSNADRGSYTQDPQGFYGGPASPTTPTAGRRGSGIPNFRPSPARTPVIEHGGFDLNIEELPPPRPTGSGITRPSLDSHASHVSASRFTEDV